MNDDYEAVYPKSYQDVFGKYGGAYDYFWGNGSEYIDQLQDSLNSFYNN